MTEREFKYCDLTAELKEKLLQQIDCGEWKHSWHLPRDPYGYVDWNNAVTIRKINEALVRIAAKAFQDLADACECLSIVATKCYLTAENGGV